ncbi:MAG: CHC2 zinc finger domain-containing protein, partial [Patescibacteria group bacterium]
MAGNVVEYKQASIADFGYIFDFFNVSDTQQIKEKIDIVDFLGEYVQLRPAGVNHKGLCPF